MGELLVTLLEPLFEGAMERLMAQFCNLLAGVWEGPQQSFL